ncbi:hypothetical protein [Arthrobacter flavus]|uniref:Uncharacterized protein n=1 Tax=Arthrobacter flavus TaxID=95172 RepID=A0ABW4Q6A9_9MICC
MTPEPQGGTARGLRRFFSDRDGNLVIGQFPNIPIIGWLVLMVAAALTPDPGVSAVLAFFSAAFLFTWAYLELAQGDSPFRRVLGAGALIYLVVSRLIS